MRLKNSTLLTAAGLLAVAASTAPAATFTVDSLGDVGDLVAGDSLCATSAGDCTLRAALEESNALAGDDTILFDLPGSSPFRIMLASELPAVSDTVVIDGLSQSQALAGPVIGVDGDNLTNSFDRALVLDADGCTVKGLGFTNFPATALEVNSDNNFIVANNIGVTPGGQAAGNHGTGIDVRGAGNTIGASGPGAGGNVIADNLGRGIFVGVSANPDGNTFQANWIGTNRAGDPGLGNSREGILVNATDGTTIGGDKRLGLGNIIVNNGDEGIRLISSTNAVIEGNYIGTTGGGASGFGNGGTGIQVERGSGNTIGTTPVDETGNVVVDNAGAGIRLVDSSGNGVFGNRIDDADGQTPLPNDGVAVAVVEDSGTSVGNSIRSNRFDLSESIGIDLGEDGADSNDTDDADTGPNGRQNSPEITQISYDADADELVVEYRVDATTANADYNLTVDFYATGTNIDDGPVHLGTDMYPSAEAQALRTGRAGPVPELVADLVATATDSSGNTSELSEPVAYDGSVIFADRFD